MAMSKEHFERERAAHYAELHARRRERQHGDIGERRGAYRKRERPRNTARRETRGPSDDTVSFTRSASELRDDLSYLHAALYSETDPRRREEIELEIFRMTTGAP